MEREQERDEFQRNITELTDKFEETKKEKEKLENLISFQKLEFNDYEIRLKDTSEVEQELAIRAEKTEEELKSAVDKVFNDGIENRKYNMSKLNYCCRQVRQCTMLFLDFFRFTNYVILFVTWKNKLTQLL